MTGLQITITILTINAIVWTLVFLRIRHQMTMLQEDMRRSGKLTVIAPESASFRGSTNRYGMVKSLGVIMLTEKMLIFKKAFASEMRIPVSDIVDISKYEWFLQSYHSGKEHLILKLNDGTQIGFIVNDVNRWIRELSGRMSSTKSITYLI
ncbi:MAG: hypothetical protein ACYC0V_07830 [Armatimonadota bacterium]